MANKEATIYVIDVGVGMKERREDANGETTLQWAMKYVLDKIQYKILRGLKTDQVGVIFYGSKKTRNDLNDGVKDQYMNVNVVHNIAQAGMPLVEMLKDKKPEEADADVMDALIVAIDHMDKVTKALKYTRRICLITSAHYLVPSDAEPVIARITERGMLLQILGIDFDDPSFPYKEEDKPLTKRQNEQFLHKLADDAGGAVFTMAEALLDVSRPFVRSVAPTKTFAGRLQLGDPDQNPESAVDINVELYPHVKIARPIAAKKYYPGPGKEASGEQPSVRVVDIHEEDPAREVRMDRHYFFHRDENDPAPEKLVEDRDQMEKAWAYGKTLIPMRTIDQDLLTLPTRKCMTIIGFFNQKTFDRSLLMDETFMLVAPKVDPHAQAALSSLIHALYEKESMALVRYVRTDKNEAPRLAVLIPHIKAEYECFWFMKVPFDEDVRNYQFAPLDKVKTVTGKVYTSHALLPTDKQLETMDKFIDSWDLMHLDDQEYLKPREVFHPGIHRINQGIMYRALHPDADELPPPDPSLTQYNQPPEHMVKRTEGIVKELIDVFQVAKIPERNSKKRAKEATPDQGEIDLDALLAGGPSKKVRDADSAKDGDTKVRQEFNASEAKVTGPRVTYEDPIKTFKEIVSGQADMISEGVAQMLRIIKSLVLDMDDEKYALAIECLVVVRKTAAAEDEIMTYNEFLRDLKRRVFDSADHKAFWKQLKHYVTDHNGAKVSLIAREENIDADVSEQESKQFLKDEFVA